MQYYLLLIVAYSISWLPFPLLYLLSDGVNFVLFKIIGYRKDVVKSNLRQAFPNATDIEIKIIEKKFYQAFCDQWLETLKLLTISKDNLMKRVSANIDPFLDYHIKGVNCNALMAHNFNFEWASAVTSWLIPQKFIGVYMPVSSKAVDRLMLKIRSRSNTLLVSASKFKDALATKNQDQYVVGLIADQNPANRRAAQWEPFFGKLAPFHKAPATSAVRRNDAVAFAYVKRIKRGKYHIEIEHYCYGAKDLDPQEIVRDYIKFIEQKITEQPETYLWTHKRWKYSPS